MPRLWQYQLRFQKYLNQILTCYRCRNKRRSHHGHISYNVWWTTKSYFIGEIPLSYYEITCGTYRKGYLVNRACTTRVNWTNATLLICLYTTFVKPYMHYASTALTALNKSQKDSLEKIQNYCVHYTRRAVDTGKPVFLMINFVFVLTLLA